jgi:hypothetical protein
MKHALLERLYLAVFASRAFRKGHYGFSIPDFLSRNIKTFQGLIVLMPVNFNISGVSHRCAEKGDLEKFLFGDPSKLPRNKAENDQNIKIALMIRPACWKA